MPPQINRQGVFPILAPWCVKHRREMKLSLQWNVVDEKAQLVAGSKQIWYCEDCKHDHECANRIIRSFGWNRGT